MGGAEAVLEKARASFEEGDYRWVAEVVNHVVFAEPENREARELQADALEQLGYGAENATWRNFFLMGAKELREGISGTPTATAPPDVVARLSVSQLLDAMAIRLDGPRAWEHAPADRLERHRPRRAARDHGPQRRPPPPPRQPRPAADAALVVEREALDQLLLKTADIGELAESGRLRVEGDGEKLGELLGLLDEPDPGFAIVTPMAGAPPQNARQEPRLSVLGRGTRHPTRKHTSFRSLGAHQRARRNISSSS